MKEHPLTTACQILWPQRDLPHPALRFAPWEAACWVVAGWDRRAMARAPLLARRALCKIATLEYGDGEVQEFLVAWACTEATHWWHAFNGQPPTRKMLGVLYADFIETGRI
ncbi:MAG: hypothetical protein IT405_01005 [Candidatus Yanofskybacteria bacterium]|nr:hypothetical protein [Candidatus Yanofskybacteria bacterium]